ncbi:MAG: hypothetical protein FJ280_13120 [Planctomycetes bacterium]|nr:hypothetical protein [Planctomycetota bacterium]
MSDPTVLKPSRRRGWLWLFVATPLVALLFIWVLNYQLVGHPVQTKLSADPRNQGYSLSAHFRYYVDPSVLVLDLRAVESAAPVDLFRALFQSAEALHESGRRFDRVVLARAGSPVFLMEGEAFSTIGAEFSAGQNPAYLIRTLPEKLFRPSGQPAFDRWEGGWLGVLGEQMEDANQAAHQWASASEQRLTTGSSGGRCVPPLNRRVSGTEGEVI